jgi:hypothetical protein
MWLTIRLSSLSTTVVGLGLLRMRKKLLDSIIQGPTFCLSIVCCLGSKKCKHTIAPFAGCLACALIFTCSFVKATPTMPRHKWPESLNGGEVLDAKVVNDLGARQAGVVLQVEHRVGENLAEICGGFGARRPNISP